MCLSGGLLTCVTVLNNTKKDSRILLWCAGFLIYSTSTAWSNIRNLCPKCSSCNSPEREHRNSLRLCTVVLFWQLTIRSNKQTADNLVVVNLSNPDKTAVESTSWEIRLVSDDVFANVTSFLMELTSLLKMLSCISYHTAAYLLIPPQDHISNNFPIATNYPWCKVQTVVRRLNCRYRVYLAWVNLEKWSPISYKHVSIDHSTHK